MSLAILYTRASLGIHAPLVTVEVHLSNGLPAFSIVGLPEAVVKESKERVRSALINSQFEFPIRRITINLGPADLPKEGGRYDLPIALGILAASGQIPSEKLKEYEFAGELALSGALKPIQGTLPFALQTRQVSRQLVIPEGNIEEALLCSDITILPSKHLLDICAHLQDKQLLIPNAGLTPFHHEKKPIKNLSEVIGQSHAKRALEIAAAGSHSLLMIGPPGTGKTMLANCLPGILPELMYEEALEVAAIQSISSRGFQFSQWQQRPFRTPHHTASTVALVGGGRPPKPGEISLAHHGILFLDELPEFNQHVLESLREPLESGTITISRAASQAEFPARFQLIATMNPCPCGYLGDGTERCHCTKEHVQRYQKRLSGPLLDRIDMFIEVPYLPQDKLIQSQTPSVVENSKAVQSRVVLARSIQLERAHKLNTSLLSEDFSIYCQLDEASQQLISQAIKKLNLSARAYHRILRIARTIADLAQSKNIMLNHLTEAISYRRFLKNA